MTGWRGGGCVFITMSVVNDVSGRVFFFTRSNSFRSKIPWSAHEFENGDSPIMVLIDVSKNGSRALHGVGGVGQFHQRDESILWADVVFGKFGGNSDGSEDSDVVDFGNRSDEELQSRRSQVFRQNFTFSSRQRLGVNGSH